MDQSIGIRPPGLIVTLAATLPALCGSLPGLVASETAIPVLALSACDVPGVSGEVLCGRLNVPENRSIEQGRTIDLNIVVLPALEDPKAPEPVFLLHGGPGGAATELAPLFAGGRPWRERDLVFIDQRGTGGSNPLRCDPPDFAGMMRLVLEFDFPDLERCRQTLDADLTQYTTSIAIEDLEAVRRALGAKRVNLWGGSYGSRVALEYARRHPANLRAMVMQGVGPTTLNVPLHFARSSQIALEEVFADCAEDPACRAAFPDLAEKYATVLDSLAHQPASVSVANPLTGEDEALEVTRQLFAGIIHYMLYTQQTANSIPLTVARSFEGDFAPAMQGATLLVAQLSRLYFGMTLSVVCAEDAPYFTREDAELLADNTPLGSTFAINILRACSQWPRAEIPRDYRQPVVSDVPTLLVSGSADPVTPYYLAMQVDEGLSNSRHLVLQDAGHSTLGSPCLPEILERFFAEASVANLDASCLEALDRGEFQGAQ